MFVIELRSLFSSISQRKLSSRYYFLSVFCEFSFSVFFSRSAKSARQDPVSGSSPPPLSVAATMQSRDHVARSRKLEHFHVATRRTGSSFFFSFCPLFLLLLSLFLSVFFFLSVSSSLFRDVCISQSYRFRFEEIGRIQLLSLEKKIFSQTRNYLSALKLFLETNSISETRFHD